MNRYKEFPSEKGPKAFISSTGIPRIIHDGIFTLAWGQLNAIISMSSQIEFYFSYTERKDYLF